MKKGLSFILALIIILSAVPAFGENPYEIVREFSDEEITGIEVKKTDTCVEEFTLYAVYADGEKVYGVKRR